MVASQISARSAESGHDLACEEGEPVPVEGRAQRQAEPLGAGTLVLANAVAHLRRRAGEMPRPDEVGQRAEHELQLLLLLPRARFVGTDGEPDVARADDRAGIPALL